MTPVISILSAVHNEQSHIREMIASVQAQDLQEWELLFVDDGSSDQTAAIIRQYASIDSRILLISEGVKIGKVRAFNLAYTRSSAKTIILLAGDDRLPPYSLRLRSDTLAADESQVPSVAFFKIKTFSADPRFDSMILPRGRAASRSGGSITMNRLLADVLFPIDPELISEDIWLSHASVEVANRILERQDIVLEYRIHPGNSNPRNRPFSEMNESMHRRHRAWEALLSSDRIIFSESTRRHLQHLWNAEEARYRGDTAKLLLCRISLIDRIAMAASSSPRLFNLRTRFYRTFSGLRGR